jgi:hypothetical protein
MFNLLDTLEPSNDTLVYNNDKLVIFLFLAPVKFTFSTSVTQILYKKSTSCYYGSNMILHFF